MKIIIPTYRRPDAQHTFNSFSDALKARTFFVVDEQDHQTMSERDEFRTANFLISGAGIDSIAKKRAWILENFQEDKIVMLDDDLQFASRKYDGEGFKLVRSTEEEIDQAFAELEKKLDTFYHAGFSSRQGNNRKPSGWENNTRMMYVLGYNLPKVFEHLKLNQIGTREDFEYTLQLFLKGFENSVYNEICVDQKYNAQGGVSLERTVESSNADAEKLARMYPEFVKVEDRDYSTSIPRKEVRIQWKKAIDFGKNPPSSDSIW